MPQTPQKTVTVPFTGAQTVGDLNVVIVGWNDTTSVVNAVTDTVGNKYTLAVGPTQLGGAISQSIYYSNGIAARGKFYHGDLLTSCELPGYSSFGVQRD